MEPSPEPCISVFDYVSSTAPRLPYACLTAGTPRSFKHSLNLLKKTCAIYCAHCVQAPPLLQPPAIPLNQPHNLPQPLLCSYAVLDTRTQTRSMTLRLTLFHNGLNTDHHAIVGLFATTASDHCIASTGIYSERHSGTENPKGQPEGIPD